MMPKFSKAQLSKVDDKCGYLFECPGCGCAHYIQTNKSFSPCWNFNGDVYNPTVSPSIRVVAPMHGRPDRICHSFIKNGKIQFLNDCTHGLAGQTVELLEL